MLFRSKKKINFSLGLSLGKSSGEAVNLYPMSRVRGRTFVADCVMFEERHEVRCGGDHGGGPNEAVGTFQPS